MAAGALFRRAATERPCETEEPSPVQFQLEERRDGPGPGYEADIISGGSARSGRREIGAIAVLPIREMTVNLEAQLVRELLVASQDSGILVIAAKQRRCRIDILEIGALPCGDGRGAAIVEGYHDAARSPALSRHDIILLLGIPVI